VTASRHGPGWCPWPVPALVREAAGLGLSTLAVGAVLHALAPGGLPLIRHVVAAGAALLVWCYCDGMAGRLSWGLAAVEALLRLRLSLAWAELLCDAWGSHVG
jgi:hypothetical protein